MITDWCRTSRLRTPAGRVAMYDSARIAPRAARDDHDWARFRRGGCERRRIAHSGKLSLRITAWNRGSERSGSSSGSTLKSTTNASCSATARSMRSSARCFSPAAAKPAASSAALVAGLRPRESRMARAASARFVRAYSTTRAIGRRDSVATGKREHRLGASVVLLTERDFRVPHVPHARGAVLGRRIHQLSTRAVEILLVVRDAGRGHDLRRCGVELRGEPQLSPGLIEPTHRAKESGVRRMTLRSSRIELDRPPKMALGLGPVPIVAEDLRGQRLLRFCARRVEGRGAESGVARQPQHLGIRGVTEDGDARQRGRPRGPRTGKAAVERDRAVGEGQR